MHNVDTKQLQGKIKVEIVVVNLLQLQNSVSFIFNLDQFLENQY